MSRLIDADNLPYENMEISATSGEWCVRLSDIDDAPTVDAEPVIRCRDCKHSMMHDFIDKKHLACVDVDEDGTVGFAKSIEPNDFCSRGEKKGNENNGN